MIKTDATGYVIQQVEWHCSWSDRDRWDKHPWSDRNLRLHGEKNDAGIEREHESHKRLRVVYYARAILARSPLSSIFFEIMKVGALYFLLFLDAGGGVLVAFLSQLSSPDIKISLNAHAHRESETTSSSISYLAYFNIL